MSLLQKYFKPLVGPTQTEIASPYIVISNKYHETSALPSSDDIIISSEDGTLISYVEEWQGKQYGVTLEMIDPDGIFISRMFSAVIQNMKNYFHNLSNLDDSLGRSSQIYVFYKNHLANILKLKNENRDSPYELSTEELNNAKEDAFNAALRQFERQETGERRIDSTGKLLQKYLKVLDLTPHVYINIGYGHESLGNQSGYRKFHIQNVILSQDTGREHKVIVKLVPNPQGLSDTSDAGIQPNQTEVQEGAPSYFPAAHDKANPPLVFQATYKSEPVPGQTLDQLKNLPIKKIKRDHTHSMVHLIETLLEEYLIDADMNALVCINPALDNAIRTEIEGSSDAARSKFLLNLGKKLKECGLHILPEQTREFDGVSEELANNTYFPSVGAGMARLFNNIVGAEVEFTYTLHLQVNENIDRPKRVLQIIRDLYEVFNIDPSEVTYTHTYNTDRIINIYDQLYEKSPTKGYGKPRLVATTKYIENAEKNLIVIGDSFFIESVIYPTDPNFSLQQYEGYLRYISDVLKLDTTGRAGFSMTAGDRIEGNIARFIKGVKGTGLRSYTEKYVQQTVLVVRPSLGENIIPDEFASRFTNDGLYDILQNSIVLIAGSENSNVISVLSEENDLTLVEFNSFYNIARNFGIKEARDAVIQGYDKGGKRQPDITEKEIDNLIDKVLLNVYAEGSVTRMLEEVYNKDIEETEPVAYLKNMYKAVVDEIRNSTLVKNRSIDPKALKNYLIFMNKLAHQTRTLVVKTSPSFYINENSNLFSPAFFFHANPFNTHSQSLFSAMSIFTGLYKIIGYKHTINQNECHTELVLLRNILSDTLNFGASVGGVE